MRVVSCPICSAAPSKLVFAATLPSEFDEASPPSPYSAHYQINRCLGCGLIYSSPIMGAAGVAALYRNSSETNVVPGEEDNVRRTMAGYYRLAAPHLQGRMRMLDVGCDMGFMLEVAAKDGFAELHGIEPNPIARSVARRIGGAHVIDGFYGAAVYPTDHFDLVSLIHVLDHLADPRVVLARARCELRPGGVIVAVVHNVGSLLAKMLGERFPVYNLYHHFFFDRRTLAELFRRQGFDVIEVVSTHNCYSLGFFARRLPLCPTPLRESIAQAMEAIRLAKVPISLPVGNIGIVACRPVQ